MNLIKINLLPYREREEAQRKKEFNLILGLGAIAGVALAGMIYVFLSEAIDNQESRNASLEAGKTELEAKLKTIEELNTRKHNFLERKRKVEELDNKRFEGARIVDGLDSMVPDGAYLYSVVAETPNSSNMNQSNYKFNGFALSDIQISAFMSALPRTGIFDVPKIGVIESEGDVQKFTLETVLVKQIYKPKPKAVAPVAAASAASAPAK